MKRSKMGSLFKSEPTAMMSNNVLAKPHLEMVNQGAGAQHVSIGFINSPRDNTFLGSEPLLNKLHDSLEQQGVMSRFFCMDFVHISASDSRHHALNND